MSAISDNQRYHEIYDNDKHLAIRAVVDEQVADQTSYIIMNLLIDVCIDVSHGLITDKPEALARSCFDLTLESVHQMSEYISTFETLHSRNVGADIYLMVQVHHKLQEAQRLLQEATAMSSNIHVGRASMLYHLLRASSDLVDASHAVQVAQHHDYIAEKIGSGITQLDYTLQSALKLSDRDRVYNFSHKIFPW